MLDALRAGALDAVLLDSPFALTEAKDDSSLAVLEELFSSEEFGVVLPKEVDPAFKALVDEVVRQERDALYEKWFK
jgi:ABC-type amino acid transport substrate-binding protein